MSADVRVLDTNEGKAHQAFKDGDHEAAHFYAALALVDEQRKTHETIRAVEKQRHDRYISHLRAQAGI